MAMVEKKLMDDSTSMSMTKSRQCVSGINAIGAPGIKSILVGCFALLACVTYCQAEYFSSTDNVQLLGDLELELVGAYRGYMQKQKEELSRFSKFLQHVKAQHEIALEDPEEYVANPLNAFTLIKRMTIDWQHLNDYLKENQVLKELRQSLEKLNEEMPFPDDSELRGAAKGIGRLQNVYQLNETDLADGIVYNLEYETKLDWHDCFELGANLFEAKEYKLATKWLELTLDKLEEDDSAKAKKTAENADEPAKAALTKDAQDEIIEDGQIENVDETVEEPTEFEDDEDPADFDEDTEEEVEEDNEEELEEENEEDDDKVEPAKKIEEIAENEIGNATLANQSASKISSEITDNTEIKDKFTSDTLEYLVMAYQALEEREKAIHYIGALLENEPEHPFKDLEIFLRNTQPKVVQEHLDHGWLRNYTRLCRGEVVPEAVHRKLECQLTTNGNAAFVLAPLRKEQLALEPEVSMYHGLLNDAQIEKILNEGYEQGIERSKVNAVVGSQIQDIRVSQQTWLAYNSTVMKTVYRLASNITGYNLKNAETMQLANYGIGGQYDPHHDFLGVNHTTSWIGDRLATLMFYFSDVDQGGYTVFPKANAFTRPTKGSLVMWHNLHKDLEPDQRTLHAGCPVVTGTKRIGNVWIHSGLQDFARPCELKPDNYKSAGQ